MKDEKLETTDFVFATTRGTSAITPGLLAILRHDTQTGSMALLNLWPTPTSGGKANAIEFRPEADEEGRILLVMTDDEQGWVMILEWDSSSLENPIKLISKSLIDKLGVGASHAVWL